MSEPATPTQLAVVTGMSGAGRSTAARVLEDLGWFVVDNLPPTLLPTMVEMGARAAGALPRLAVVVDVRSGSFFADLRTALEEVSAQAVQPRILFLEASDDVLVRRFESVRRRHPLQGDARVLDGIARERTLIADLREAADLVIDTSDLNVHELRGRIEEAFDATVADQLRVAVVSFGYKYGLPVDADLVLDVRFLPNPHWVAELRDRTGRDPAVAGYVLGQPDAEPAVAAFTALVAALAPGYLREGKRYLTVAVGCTGGKHRSVAISEELARRMAADPLLAPRVSHRDLGRE